MGENTKSARHCKKGMSQLRTIPCLFGECVKKESNLEAMEEEEEEECWVEQMFGIRRNIRNENPWSQYLGLFLPLTGTGSCRSRISLSHQAKV